MNEEQFDELTPQEREAFEKLEVGTDPPRSLENRIVSELAERGLLRRETWVERLSHRVPVVPRLALGLGALVAAFTLGVQYGRQDPVPTVPSAIVEPTEPEATPQENSDGMGTFLASHSQIDTMAALASSGFDKPSVDALDGSASYGEFPPYPLDGRARSISPKYR